MAFANFEESRFEGTPKTLYHFQYGEEADSYYAYTDNEEDITFGGKVYVATPITRGNIVSQGNLDKSTMEVTAPRDIEVAGLFTLWVPSSPVTLTIRQGHLDDPDNEWPVCWAGLVLGSTRVDSDVKFTCEPASSSMRRPGLREFYGTSCPHVVYEENSCRANKAARTRAGQTVNALSGFNVTLESGWQGAFENRVFRNGWIEWVKDGRRHIRSILSVTSGGVIKIKGAISGLLEVGDTVDVVAGCNHQRTDCLTLHENIHNYGGQDWIPYKNPHRSVNNWG